MNIRSNRFLKGIIWEFRFTKFLFNMCIFLNSSKKIFGAQQVIRLKKWATANFSSPAPNFVKWNVLLRWGGKETWIETGTYLGETTGQLAHLARVVYSVEPEELLFKNAIEKFRSIKNVTILNGSSETVLPNLLEALSQQEVVDVSFWLDGHYSAGVTYLGKDETPIVAELNCISDSILRFSKITIFVDDVRQFSATDDTEGVYPSLSYLVSFADSHGLYWIIEHDIFIMTNRSSLRS